MTQIKLKGSCLCGAVKYEVTGDPKGFYHCHCSRCRKSSGTGHASNLIMTDATIVFTHGETLLKQYKIPEAERFARQFCTECGSPVARFVPELNGVVVPAGAVVSPSSVTPAPAANVAAPPVMSNAIAERPATQLELVSVIVFGDADVHCSMAPSSDVVGVSVVPVIVRPAAKAITAPPTRRPT